MVFVPSREGGVSTSGERIAIETVNSIGLDQLAGKQVPSIDNPGNLAVSDWGISHLLYFVGLPARAEKNEHSARNRGEMEIDHQSD
jgi:hypothetical protein